MEYKLSLLQKLVDEDKVIQIRMEELNKIIDKQRDFQNRWMDAEVCHPHDDSVLENTKCLISWWDEAIESYCDPILVVWSKSRNAFFLPQSTGDCPLRVDIWCYWPELPKEKL